VGPERRRSPQQIADWLPEAFPDDPEMRVSHETIHMSLFVQGRGALRQELFRCLRQGRAMRRPQGHRQATGQGKIRDVVMISERPAEIVRPGLPVPRPRTAGGTCRESAEISPGPDTTPSPSTAPAGKHGQQLRFHRHRPLRHAQWATWRQLECQRCPARDLSAISRYCTGVPGNADPTRTPMVCCASTSPRAPSSRAIPRHI